MEYYHNPGKALEIEVAGERYLRHGIRTHFVEVGRTIWTSFAAMWCRSTGQGTGWR